MIIIENRFRHWVGILAAIFLGMTFVVAGMGKWFAGVVDFQLLPLIEDLELFAPPWFLLSEHTMGISLAKALYTWQIPIELGIGILLVVGILVKSIASFSLLLTTVFIISNILLIASGLGGEPCGCFGMGQELTVFDSLWLDGIMVALAVTILVFYPSRFFNVRPWYWGK